MHMQVSCSDAGWEKMSLVSEITTNKRRHTLKKGMGIHKILKNILCQDENFKLRRSKSSFVKKKNPKKNLSTTRGVDTLRHLRFDTASSYSIFTSEEGS